MSTWRREALGRLPQLRQDIERLEDFHGLCRLLTEQMWVAYGRADIIGGNIRHSPEDEALIASIHGYAGWCLLRGPGADSNIAFLFYESLSTGINAHIAADFARFVRPEVMAVLRGQGILTRIVGANGVEGFMAEYEDRRPRSSERSGEQ